MKKTLFLIFVIISGCLLLLQITTSLINSFFELRQKSGIRIESNPQSTVYINSQIVGETPYLTEDLTPGRYRIDLVTQESSWSTGIDLYPGTLSIINRQLSVSIASHSGEILTLESGKGIVITSTPSQADVYINDQFVGRTPYYTNQYKGDQLIRLLKDGYIGRYCRRSWFKCPTNQRWCC